MTFKLTDYQDIAREMISADDERDKFFESADRVYHLDWNKPEEWQELKWIRAFITPEAANAVDTGVRTLATNLPSFQITPLASNPETREQFNKIEQALAWLYTQASRRNQGTPTRAIVESAIKYDEVAGQVVYLPYQQKALKAINSKRAKQAMNFGPFSILVHNPRMTHVQYSDVGLERVLLCKQQRVKDVLDFWGDLASDLAAAVEGKGRDKDATAAMSEVCEVYDYSDQDNRVVWVVLGGNRSKGKEFAIISPDDPNSQNSVGFLSWFHGIGGSGVDARPDFQRRPLLANVVRSGAWDNQMMFASLMFSLAMARAAEPVTEVTTPSGEGAEVDATDPLGQLKLRTGETAGRLPAAEISTSTKEMFDRLTDWINSMGGVESLRALHVPRGTSFATVNQVIGAAMAALDPYKQLAEMGIEDVGRLMAKWLRKEGAEATFYNQQAKSPMYGQQTSVFGSQLPEDQDLYLQVRLNPWVPTEEMQKINGVIMKHTQLQFPAIRALEELNVTDAERAVAEWREEQLENAAMGEKIKDLQFEADLQRQEMQRQQQQAQQAQDAAQQQQQQQQGADITGGPPPNGQQPPIQPPNAIPGAPFENMQGQGNNPAMGGISPVGGAPAMTREQITAMAKAGLMDSRGMGMGAPDMPVNPNAAPGR